MLTVERKTLNMSLRNLVQQLDEVGDRVEVWQAQRTKVMEYMKCFPGLCYIKDCNTGRFAYCNPAFIERFGDVINKTVQEVFGLELAQRLVSYDLKVMSSNQHLITIEQLPSKNENELDDFLLIKFLIKNGVNSIGGFCLAIPKSLTLVFQEK